MPVKSVVLVSLSNISGLSLKASRSKHDLLVQRFTVLWKGFKLRFNKVSIVLKARRRCTRLFLYSCRSLNTQFIHAVKILSWKHWAGHSCCVLMKNRRSPWIPCGKTRGRDFGQDNCEHAVWASRQNINITITIKTDYRLNAGDNCLKASNDRNLTD